MLFSDIDEKKAIIEALLFVSKDPLTACEIGKTINLPEYDVRIIIGEMQADLNSENRGLNLVEIAEGFKLCTKDQYSPYIEQIFKPQKNSLSHAALETLAIIAYKQPVTKTEIELIRGVKVDKVLNSLMEKFLIEEVGRKETIGRPILYGTTSDFLEYLGLKDLEDLPKIG